MDLENRWSLLEHAPGIDCWQPDQATVQDVVSRWVAVQAAIAAEAHELRAPRMLPGELPAELEGLLAGEVGERLSADELVQARRLLDALPQIIARLDSSGLPITLVHADLHPGNWRSDGRNRVIVDWADSYVGHPATDIQRLRDWIPAEKRDHAVSTWAAAWQRHLPGCEPLRALEPATILARLFGAVTYQRFLDNIERSERVYHEDDPTYEVRAALAAYLAERDVISESL
jgi:Ser/Thr protein kinase RdoA (MazF antagonist)